MRAHSRAELATAMAKKDVSPEIVDELLDRFAELDMVDDTAFAQQWVSERQRLRGLSRRALSHELQRKGVDRDVIAEATSQVSDEDEFAAALTLAQKKLRSLRSVDDVQVKRRRLMGMLARRGYGHEVVSRVVGQLLAADDESCGA